MNNYRILYYGWGENTQSDAINILKLLGHTVVFFPAIHNKYDNDNNLISEISSTIKKNNIDFIFSFNYFPDLSRCAMSTSIPYISWCFDSPMLTLDSVTLDNNVNHVFVFDYYLFKRYTSLGHSTVHYMPLACNITRISREMSHYANKSPKYMHDITFLGNMYNNEYDFYSQLPYIPQYIKGYLDSSIESQLQIYGADILSSTITNDILTESLKYVHFDLSDLYIKDEREMFINMLRKQATVRERKRILTVMSEFFPLSLYSSSKPEEINVNYLGYADYINQMPEIFYRSKINLNITLRSIITGIPLRVIDILGANGFCLTNYQAELSEYFENDINISWYESQEELFEKTVYYLNHDDERERIASNGNKIIKEQFSYEVLFERIFKEAGLA